MRDHICLRPFHGILSFFKIGIREKGPQRAMVSVAQVTLAGVANSRALGKREPCSSIRTPQRGFSKGCFNGKLLKCVLRVVVKRFKRVGFLLRALLKGLFHGTCTSRAF